jgi:hypothetical protein
MKLQCLQSKIFRTAGNFSDVHTCSQFPHGGLILTDFSLIGDAMPANCR